VVCRRTPRHDALATHLRPAVGGKDQEVAVSEFDDFLADILGRQVEAEKAIHNGDPGPRMAM
jgi:hypothetical protein